MDTGEGVIKQFFGAEEMMEIGTAEIFAGRTIAVFVNGASVAGEFFIADIDSFVGVVTLKTILAIFAYYFAGIKGAVSGEPSGGDAIEHINAQRNGSEDIGGF